MTIDINSISSNISSTNEADTSGTYLSTTNIQ